MSLKTPAPSDLLGDDWTVEKVGTFARKKPPSVEDYPWGGFSGRKLEMVGKTRQNLIGLFDDLIVRRRRRTE